MTGLEILFVASFAAGFAVVAGSLVALALRRVRARILLVLAALLAVAALAAGVRSASISSSAMRRPVLSSSPRQASRPPPWPRPGSSRSPVAATGSATRSASSTLGG